MPGERPVRHDWVSLGADWAEHLRSPLNPDVLRMVTEWQQHGRPFTVTRQDMPDRDDELRLGLTLPDRRHLALHVALSAVVHVLPPPTVHEARSTAPATWQAALEDVIALGTVLDLTVRVFGSLAWQLRTGVTFLRPLSDVDLLFAPARWSDVERLLFGLEAVSRRHSVVRLDGEVLLPDGGAVAWRELALEPEIIWVTGPRGACPRTLKDLRALFPAEP
ncbi:malonate decarboxylase holo-[acyl-carrier-protein] synthase [Corallococcus praedator]|uniref:Malonate decarboxylase holo-[acyl-carrier-protein] synthase n=1 Tax=Corallococcus praedator TaxID=2316724 RepID=A0ABX9Q6L7_9BACT|nr:MULTISPECIES: malonate decarboxylase holo-[acyl-carrier-protein] synthase [Corallococcus]RKH02002.1 malonate decarboxylase holo-[acyl-carrier-protein] synthase [Corallococcus sp. CA047B]RKH32151.1 malonate decarboxylase holo-[acyl-carrier-protein] synthase [Corallococcus sp. CA031C]RKH92704.1 malonate decarboxylase holo-[acyl-carrier-protein] synthase [Corallococcus praedator]